MSHQIIIKSVHWPLMRGLLHVVQHSADYALCRPIALTMLSQDVRLSVASHAGIISKGLNTSNFLHQRGRQMQGV